MRRTPLLALLAALSLLVAACGDDDTDTATDDTVATETETDTETQTDTETNGTDVDEDALAESMGECGFLAGFATAFEDFDPTTMYSGGEATDFGQIFAPLAEAAQDVAEAAPDEIQESFRTMADGLRMVADELQGVVIDLSDPQAMDPETMARLETLNTSFGPEFEAASTEIEAWMTENCAEVAEGFDLDAFGS